MPVGSVRALLALIMVSVPAIMAANEMEVPQALWALTATVVAFYFASKKG